MEKTRYSNENIRRFRRTSTFSY